MRLVVLSIALAASVAAFGPAALAAERKLTGPEIEAKRYEEKLKKGNYLVAVHTSNGDQVDRAKAIREGVLQLRDSL